MPITATCPSCSQMCQVEDQYAGMMVRCPKCGNIIQTPRPDVVAGQKPPVPPAAVPLPPPVAPDLPPGPAVPGFLETIQRSAASFGLDPLGLNLIYGGVSCLAAMGLFTFLPWYGYSVGTSFLGIALVSGILNFLLSVAAIGFLIVVFVVLKTKETFDISLWVAGGWSILATMWRLVQVIGSGHATTGIVSQTSAGIAVSAHARIGLILALLASLGAGGAFGFLLFQRFLKNKLKP